MQQLCKQTLRPCLRFYMLPETIRAFFQNDLNVSTTARQLFIHRNTLLYRIEKIRKATGLDLRKFDDAVIFRMLMYSDIKQD